MTRRIYRVLVERYLRQVTTVEVTARSHSEALSKAEEIARSNRKQHWSQTRTDVMPAELLPGGRKNIRAFAAHDKSVPGLPVDSAASPMV